MEKSMPTQLACGLEAANAGSADATIKAAAVAIDAINFMNFLGYCLKTRPILGGFSDSNYGVFQKPRSAYPVGPVDVFGVALPVGGNDGGMAKASPLLLKVSS